MCQRAHAAQAAKGVFRACVYACACAHSVCMHARSRRTHSRSQAALPKTTLLAGGRIDADAVADRSRAEQATVDHTAFLPDPLLGACFQRVVVRRPNLPEKSKERWCIWREDDEGAGADEEWDENVEAYIYDEADGGYRLNPLTREVCNLPWDRGANHLRVLSATCIRWRDVAAPLLLALIDALRSDAEGLVVDIGRDVRSKTFQHAAATDVHDGHRACLLAEGIKWGAIDRCESFQMCHHVGPVFGIALGRALRSNPLGRLRSLDLGRPNAGHNAGAGIADSGMVALCDALVGGALPVLENLLLSGNNIGNPGAIALGAAASRVGVLEHCTRIDLESNRISDLRALCLALWMGGLPLVRVIDTTDDYDYPLFDGPQKEELDHLIACRQRRWVDDLAGVELMEALSDRLAKELRRAAMAPSLATEVPPGLARLEEAWQEDGPAVLDLYALYAHRDNYESLDELRRDIDITDSADMLASMHSTSADILPDAPQLRSSTRGRGRKGRRGGRGGTQGRQGGTLQGHPD
jgi:hypothetical protein